MRFKRNKSLLVTVAIYGFSQAISLGLSLFRFPLILSSSGQQALGVTLLWGSLQSWALVLVAGRVNLARLRYLESKVILESRPSLGESLLALTYFLFSNLVVSVVHLPLWAAGLPSTVSVAIIIWFLSPSFGVEQAQQGARQQFISVGLGSLVSFAATFLAIELDQFANLEKSQILNLLCWANALGVALPYALSRMRIKNDGPTLLIEKSRWTISKLYENAAVLPPAFINGFDITALTVTGNISQVPLYAISSRLALVTTLVPGALYTQVNNDLHAESSNNKPKKVFKLLAKMQGLVALSVVGYVIFGPLAIQKLSIGALQANYWLLTEFVLIALLVPIWIIFSSAILGDETTRHALGRWCFFVVIPASVSSTILFSSVIGIYGPALASFFVYLVAIAGAIWIRKKRSHELNE